MPRSSLAVMERGCEGWLTTWLIWLPPGGGGTRDQAPPPPWGHGFVPKPPPARSPPPAGRDSSVSSARAASTSYSTAAPVRNATTACPGSVAEKVTEVGTPCSRGGDKSENSTWGGADFSP